jgi:hypothetical protein
MALRERGGRGEQADGKGDGGERECGGEGECGRGAGRSTGVLAAAAWCGAIHMGVSMPMVRLVVLLVAVSDGPGRFWFVALAIVTRNHGGVTAN